MCVQDTSKLPRGPGGNFYVGQPPAHPSAPFTAILSGQPSKDTLKLIQAGLVLEPGAKGEPLLLLVLRGKATITLRSGWACFEKARFMRTPCAAQRCVVALNLQAERIACRCVDRLVRACMAQVICARAQSVWWSQRFPFVLSHPAPRAGGAASGAHRRRARRQDRAAPARVLEAGLGDRARAYVHVCEPAAPLV